jgi:diadenosine tetraphosphate (Ap4A) HIT family hydrolase
MEEVLTSSSTFRPDRFNYLQMGNALHHLHVHGIPRYATPREYGGRIWTDETFGHPPRWSTVEVPYELVSTLRKDIGQCMMTIRSANFGDNPKLFRTAPPPEI